MLDIRLFATLREGRQKVYSLPADDFNTGKDICDYLKIPYEEVAIFLINGFHSKVTDSIKDGDVISIFPPCGGG